jgi:hypothetical protein
MTTQLPDHPGRPAGIPELDSFERELLAELRSAVIQRNAATADSRPQPKRPKRTRLVAAAGSVAVAALAGGSLVLGGSPAFAVDTAPGGAVVIRIHELKDAGALESALAKEGVEASVDYSGHGSSLTVNEQGDATVGEPTTDAAGPLVPADPVPMDATFSNDASSGCGLNTAGELPIALKKDGGDYIVTLAGPTLTVNSALKLSTVTGPHGDTLVATYRFGTATCGAMLTR